MVVGQPWTAAEDAKLAELVSEHGPKKWSLIATALVSKGSKQCRRRWKNFLSADIKKGGWTAEEDAILIESHLQHGNKWTEIAKVVGGRTDNAVKNRWAALEKRRERQGGYGGAQASQSDFSDDDSPQPAPKRLCVEAPRSQKPRPRAARALSLDVTEPAWADPPPEPAPATIRVYIDATRFKMSARERTLLAELNRLHSHFEAVLTDDMPAGDGPFSPGPVVVAGAGGADLKALHHELLKLLKAASDAAATGDVWDTGARPGMGSGHAALLQRILGERLAQQAAPEALHTRITSSSTLLSFPSVVRVGDEGWGLRDLRVSRWEETTVRGRCGTRCAHSVVSSTRARAHVCLALCPQPLPLFALQPSNTQPLSLDPYLS